MVVMNEILPADCFHKPLNLNPFARNTGTAYGASLPVCVAAYNRGPFPFPSETGVAQPTSQVRAVSDIIKDSCSVFVTSDVSQGLN